MSDIPESVAAFLAGERLVVAGVSRSGTAPANAIFRKLRDAGHQVIAVNPNAQILEGQACFADIGSVPDPIHGVMIATHPTVALATARAALDRSVRHIWFHRSFGSGSVADDAVAECRARGVEPIVGGCPLMYCAPVDIGHRCFRWLLQRQGRVPL